MEKIPGLLGYWSLNDGSGLVAADGSEFGNDGDLEGTWTDDDWVDGKAGKCLNFGGVDQRVDCGNAYPLNTIGNGSFWIPFWMKSKDAVPLNYGVLFDKNQDGNNRMRLSSFGTANRLFWHSRKSAVTIEGEFSTASAPFDTEFNHIVLIINRTTNKTILYVNNIKYTTEIDISAHPTDCSNTGNLSWGARNDGVLPCEGLIDEMRIYSGIPTEEMIEYLYRHPDGIIKSYMRDLKEEIRNSLIEDSTYLALMGSPSEEPYQTYCLRNPERPTFPETIIRLMPGTYSQGLERDILSTVYTLEILVRDKTSNYEDIAKRIIRILHQRPGADLGFRAVFRRSSEIYDDEFEVYGRNLVFDVHFRRPLYK